MMPTQDPRHYLTFGRYNNPHHWYAQLQQLPNGLAKIQGIVTQLFIHPWDHILAKRQIPKHRRHEQSLRYVPAILDHCMQLYNAPLTVPRHWSKQLMVSCRDYAILSCAILKCKGIPARCRYAFNGHIWPAFYHDQVIVEHWDGYRWRRMDPRTKQDRLEHSDSYQGMQVFDLPTQQCPLAAEVWLACRSGQADPKQFGAGLQKQFHGLSYIRNAMLHDQRMLAQQESLPWDLWGDMHVDDPNHQAAHYDRLANMLLMN